MKEIERAILVISDLIDGAIADKELAGKTGLSKEIDDVILALKVSINCLQSELARQENKTLNVYINIQDTDFFQDLVEELAKLNNTEVEQVISSVLEKHKPNGGI